VLTIGEALGRSGDEESAKVRIETRMGGPMSEGHTSVQEKRKSELWWRRAASPTSPGIPSFVVWGLVAVVIAIPEIWGSVAPHWFYSISRTTGALESSWNPTRVIVVALLVAGAVVAIRRPPGAKKVPGEKRLGVSELTADRQAHHWDQHWEGLSRTELGRIKADRFGPWPEKRNKIVSLAMEVLAVVALAATVLAIALYFYAPFGSPFTLSLILYSAIFLVFGVMPNLVAYFGGPDAPFRTVFYTVEWLGRLRGGIAKLIFLSGMGVLLLHLAFYPWPSVNCVVPSHVHGFSGECVWTSPHAGG
jgi:hypothetical protein